MGPEIPEMCTGPQHLGHARRVSSWNSHQRTGGMPYSTSNSTRHRFKELNRVAAIHLACHEVPRSQQACELRWLKVELSLLGAILGEWTLACFSKAVCDVSLRAGQRSDDQHVAWQAQGGLAWRQPGQELVPDLSTGTEKQMEKKEINCFLETLEWL